MKKCKGLLLLVLVTALFAFTRLAEKQQPTEAAENQQPSEISEKQQPAETAIPCPIPMSITVTAPPPTTATLVTSDFPSSLPSNYVIEPNFGGTTANRLFRHTFRWKSPTECCQFLRGTLTLTYKTLRGGASATSPDAGNDTWAIYKNGTALASGKIYTSFPFSTGQTGTKVIPLTPAMMSGNHLSFLVQDDTSVTKATLKITACCVER